MKDNAVVLKLGSLDQQHLHHLGTYQKGNCSGTPREPPSQKFWGGGPSSLSSNKPSGDYFILNNVFGLTPPSMMATYDFWIVTH